MWYCGDWHSVKVTYENGENLIFTYPFSNNQNKQFIPFESLTRQIQNDSLLATRLNIGQLGHLYIKQGDLSNLIFMSNNENKRK
ncbi:hypothetical protein CLU83_3638 [Flavobacterium sp. 1]|nr:hypothetical protein CLU83_3638 [Flavobacterium sp. 1]